MQSEATRPEEAACIGATQAVVPDRRTVLAAIRTNLALDRTLLAWVRTALSMMAAGVAFDQGTRLLHEARLKADTALLRSSHGIGISITVASTALIAIATWTYLKSHRTVADMLGQRPPRI